MKDDGICMPAKTRFGNQTFPFEGAARCSHSRYAGEKRSMDLLTLGSSLSSAVVLLSPDTSWHHRDATPQRRGCPGSHVIDHGHCHCFAASSHTSSRKWKRGLVATVSKDLHLLCRNKFPDLTLLHRGLITVQKWGYQSRCNSLSSRSSRAPE